MPIVGFSFDKILGEKSNPVDGQVKVKRDLLIKNIKKEEISLGPKKKDELLRCDFEFSVKYDPKIGEIIVAGHMLFKDEPAELKKIFDLWKKKKELPADLTTLLLNTALIRSSIKALGISQEVGLPPHMQLPTVSPKSKASEYIG